MPRQASVGSWFQAPQKLARILAETIDQARTLADRRSLGHRRGWTRLTTVSSSDFATASAAPGDAGNRLAAAVQGVDCPHSGLLNKIW